VNEELSLLDLGKSMIKIRRGLDVPISGAPEQAISDGPAIRTVAVIGDDFIGMKPTMEVAVGDQVRKGQALFSDKKNPGIVFTAPASGKISAINRGAKRILLSVVIDVEGSDEETFESCSAGEIASLSSSRVEENLVRSGLWASLRTRPYSKIPELGSRPNSIFVTAMDTNPLAADPENWISEHHEAFANGLQVLARLTEGNVYVCVADGSGLNFSGERIQQKSFTGPHPAGLAGTHIHHLDPVSAGKTVWTINYQDVIATGYLFTTGKLYTDRVVSLAGPQVRIPRVVRTVMGASLEELTAGELESSDTGSNRLISGSVLSGRNAIGPLAFLGRYHQQVTVLKEGYHRDFMGWLSPGFKRHSVLGIYITSFFGKGMKLDMTTNTNGSERGMVPVGAYEKIMPLDILPTHLLRYLIVGDTDMAQQLGCLELDEEDLALCTYVCPGKYEYGPILRDNLTRIEQDG
jgi:Na+-transporting NADH:ubiquinone oxidoreductase subunit A